MPTVVNRLIRIAACLAAGLATFVHSPVTGVTLALEIATYLIGTTTVTCLLILDTALLTRYPPWLVGALVLTAVGSGAMFTAPHAGWLIAFCLIAVVAASMDTASASGWLVTGTAILAVEAGVVIWTATTATAIGYPLLLSLLFISGRNRRAYALQAEQSAAMVVQLEQLRAEQRQVAMLDERARIAREIHDVLAHSLGALGIQVQVARAVLTEQRDVERALGLLEQAQRMVRAGLDDSRRAIQALRGDSTNLDQQIITLVESHRGLHHTDVDLRIEGDRMALTPEATVALVRTAQEALVNTAKHAPHQPVAIRLRYDPNEVELTVSNQLTGATAVADQTKGVRFSSVDGGYGLTGMRERLLLLNGSLVTGSDDRCWTVTALVPQ